MSKQKKVTKKFVRDVFINLQNNMRLLHYDFSLNWMDDDDEFGSAIRIEPNTTYLRAVLYVYPCVFNGTREEFIEYAKHELIHIILQPIVDIAEEHASSDRINKPLENAVEHLRKLINFK